MLAAAAVVLLLWLIQLVLVLLIVRAVPPVSSLPAPPSEMAWPRLSIVVPARNEPEIESALRSKLGCGYPELEIIALDDRSDDGTGARIDRIAAEDPRVRAVHLTTLPEGWLGKLHALHHGVALSSGSWVLLSDADVHIEPGALHTLIAHAERERLDMLAVIPKMRAVSLPVDAGVVSLLRMIFLSSRGWSSNDDRSRVAVGVGAFNLVRRENLLSTRAIEELRMEVADDIALAALIKQSGGRFQLLVGRGQVHIAFVDSFAAAARSAAKAGGMFR